MFFRIKTAGSHQYLQIVHSVREGKKVRQQALGTLGRFDELKASGRLEALIRSGLRHCENFAVIDAHTAGETVLHRLFASGSDRAAERWREDYLIPGAEELELHHLYRAMGFLGEPIEPEGEKLLSTPRCHKDLIEEALFERGRDLFTEVDLVFFDTTSLYFEGCGGETMGQRATTKIIGPI